MPGGKRYQAERLVKLIPPHRIYVEPFAGAAAVFWRKAPSQIEVLNDKDPEIAFFYRYVQKHGTEDAAWLQSQFHRVSRADFERAKRLRPTNDRERFYRFFMLQQFSWRGNRKNFQPSRAKNPYSCTGTLRRLKDYQQRLRGVKIFNQDYHVIMRRYDSPETFFYLDPPYGPAEGERLNAEWYGGINWADLARFVRHLRGKVLISAPSEVHRLFTGMTIKRYRVKKMGTRTAFHGTD